METGEQRSPDFQFSACHGRGHFGTLRRFFQVACDNVGHVAWLI